MDTPIKALIFDAEGVVIDTMRSVWVPADIEFCSRRGYGYPNELKAKLAGKSLIDGVRIMKTFFGFDGDDEELVNERLSIVNQLFKKGVNFVDGFEDFFSKNKSLPVAIGTSLRPNYLKLVEESVKLKELFNGHVYSIYGLEVVRSKPHPDIFLYAAKKLGVDPSNCVVFEDAPNGIESARQAGMRCIALTTSFSKEDLIGATLIVDDYREIDLSYLEKQPLP